MSLLRLRAGTARHPFELVRHAPTPISPDLDMSDPSSSTIGPTAGRFSARRLWPVLAIALAVALVYGMGWHRELSLQTLVLHRAIIDNFVAEHRFAAIAAFVVIYVAVAALSIPAGTVLTTTG